jgi:hypothetical protein
MLHKGEKKLILYLEDWQRRMVKDFLGVDCHTYEVKIGGAAEPLPPYGVSTDDSLKRMYFTNRQIREMRDEAGVACEFLELHKGQIHLLYGYGIPID